jgi:hypothetical protein
LPAGALVLGLALGGHALWDYHRVRQLYLAPEERDPSYRENTLARVGASRRYADEVNFAILTTTPLTPDSAQRIHALAQGLLHYSPEPVVIEALIGSACLSGHGELAVFHQIRYRAAYPKDYARWSQRQPDCPSVPAPDRGSPVPRPDSSQTP